MTFVLDKYKFLIFIALSSICQGGFVSQLSRGDLLRSCVKTSTALKYGKTGGKLIETQEAFTKEVLFNYDATDGSASTAIASEKLILAYFSAPWCGPCRLSNPVVKDIMKQFSNEIEVVEICTDDLPDVASDAGVVSIPTIQIYYKGEIKDTIVGCVAKNILASAVTKILEDIID